MKDMRWQWTFISANSAVFFPGRATSLKPAKQWRNFWNIPLAHWWTWPQANKSEQMTNSMWVGVGNSTSSSLFYVKRSECSISRGGLCMVLLRIHFTNNVGFRFELCPWLTMFGSIITLVWLHLWECRFTALPLAFSDRSPQRLWDFLRLPFQRHSIATCSTPLCLSVVPGMCGVWVSDEEREREREFLQSESMNALLEAARCWFARDGDGLTLYSHRA